MYKIRKKSWPKVIDKEVQMTTTSKRIPGQNKEFWHFHLPKLEISCGVARKSPQILLSLLYSMA